jgi:hypothetical protein
VDTVFPSVTLFEKTGNIQGLMTGASWVSAPIQDMASSPAMSVLTGVTRTARAAAALYPAVRGQAPAFVGFVLALQYRGSRGDVYNILWAVVFGFATLNILSLAARRFEPTRRGLTFGELMAVMVVILSILLLGWEMLNLLHIFPIKLRR